MSAVEGNAGVIGVCDVEDDGDSLELAVPKGWTGKLKDSRLPLCPAPARDIDREWEYNGLRTRDSPGVVVRHDGLSVRTFSGGNLTGLASPPEADGDSRGWRSAENWLLAVEAEPVASRSMIYTHAVLEVVRELY